MGKDLREVLNRRDFFAGALRYVTLGLLTAGGAVVFAKRQRLVRAGQCINNGICDRCKVLQKCELPAAVAVRKNLAGVANGGK